jgi:thioredoxin-dependent peroxiredoxin
MEIVGVSFDKPEANAEFVKAEGFPFRLLSDTEHTLARAAGAASSDSQLYASRISYLVGPDGKVKKVYGEVIPATHAVTVLSDM